MGRMLAILAKPTGPARYRFTPISSNRKVGRLPVVLSGRQTCPPSCAFYASGCYALGWPLNAHWANTTEAGAPLGDVLGEIARLPPGLPWRWGTAGDLPGIGDSIDVDELRELVAANAGRPGWAYTHKPLTPKNAEAIAEANSNGFTVNVSADHPSAADEPMRLGLPAVAVVPDQGADWRTTTTPKGRRVVRCPAEYSRTQCAQCGAGEPLCSRPDRDYAVGFTPHGSARQRCAQASREAGSQS